MSQSDENPILDVAIAGGGVSGVYSGWRLLSASPGLNVQLFELSDRIGGRLLSLVPPLVDDTPVEVGGMRYTSEHTHVIGLINELGLKSAPLPAGKPGNLAYLRGKRLLQSDLTDPAKLPYQLSADEIAPDQLGNLTALAAVRSLKAAFKEVLDFDLTLETLKQVTPDQWKKVAEEGKYEGEPLGDTPMRYMMLRSMSHEAFQLDEDSSGYDSILFTWNGADGFPWNLADFSGDVVYYGIVGGYNQVPILVAGRFTAAGGKIHLRTELRNFSDTLLPDGTQGVRFTTRGADGVEQTRLARRLILAMPRRSLELLDQTGPLLDPSQKQVRKLIESVTPIPLFKIALCYERPWWEKVVGPNSSGKSATDLPIRQCYYWHVNPQNHHGVILIYDDGLDLKYWEDLRNLEMEQAFTHASAVVAAAKNKNLSPEGVQLPSWFAFPAPKRMVDEVHRQLCELHGISPADAPRPYAAAFRDWGEDPYGGGANFWCVGVKSYEVEQAIIQPRQDVPVFVCGECWSHGQGWVEGALATAEMMLQGPFGLQPPPWSQTKSPS